MIDIILGPILDAYGPNYVIIPGSIGIVASMICFSFSKGTYMYNCKYKYLFSILLLPAAASMHLIMK